MSEPVPEWGVEDQDDVVPLHPSQALEDDLGDEYEAIDPVLVEALAYIMGLID